MHEICEFVNFFLKFFTIYRIFLILGRSHLLEAQEGPTWVWYHWKVWTNLHLMRKKSVGTNRHIFCNYFWKFQIWSNLRKFCNSKIRQNSVLFEAKIIFVCLFCIKMMNITHIINIKLFGGIQTIFFGKILIFRQIFNEFRKWTQNFLIFWWNFGTKTSISSLILDVFAWSKKQ